MKNAQSLEMLVNSADVRAKLGRIAKYDRTRARKIDMDIVDHLTGARAHDKDTIG